MRRTLVTLLLAGTLLAAGLFVASPASACSCVEGTTAGFFDAADAVFTGSLVSREVERTGPVASSADPALHVFAVDTVYKGTVEEEQGVLSPDSGASCGLELTGDGRVVVFASRSADDGVGPFTTLADDQYAAFLCGGSGPLDPSLEAELVALRGPVDPPAAPTVGSAPTAAEPAATGTPLWAVALAAMAVLVCGLGARGLLHQRASR